MDKDSFWRVEALIADHPEFDKGSIREQRPVAWQPACFLCRMGAETGLKTAAFCGVAEGAVYDYSDRVVQAIRRKRSELLGWPGAERRDHISAQMAEAGFPGCLGSCDGTYFRLADKPGENGYAYWCHKKFYALVLQAVVDNRGMFMAYEFGWPGCVQDSRVFTESDLWVNREKYFREHEFILVDKGYPLTPFSIRPFTDFDLTNDPAEAARRKRWNQQLSSQRIYVEHAFGRLKGRFEWLRCIPSHNKEEIFRILEALLILHNFLEARNDDPATIEGYYGEDEPMEEDLLERPSHLNLVGDSLHSAGVQRRKYLLDYMDRM
ncbi:DDE superfamily endonuclease [Phanerochaete sordida]|uniref:DDE superfamily endonuclease n=1 Tax=Phanerochaete sordida TaxID=48140 RepID=A0A9P3GYZ7_9APHY|nr:DDE superfamily endonuclease [Phanerochaete sordida]